jgi:hypothetical protein
MRLRTAGAASRTARWSATSPSSRGTDTPATIHGDAELVQSGSLLAGSLGRAALTGQFTAADAFYVATASFTVPDSPCAGSAAIAVHGVHGVPGSQVDAAVFTLSATCAGLTETTSTTLPPGPRPGPGPKR